MKHRLKSSMIKKFRKYFKLELNGISLEYGIGILSAGMIGFVAADAPPSHFGKMGMLSPLQRILIGYVASPIGILFLCHFIACYIKFRLKYKIYIQLRKVLIIFSFWFLVIIYTILVLKFPWMKVLIFPAEILVVLVFVFALYLNSAIEQFNDFVSDYMENLSLNETEKEDA